MTEQTNPYGSLLTCQVANLDLKENDLLVVTINTKEFIKTIPLEVQEDEPLVAAAMQSVLENIEAGILEVLKDRQSQPNPTPVLVVFDTLDVAVVRKAEALGLIEQLEKTLAKLKSAWGEK